MRWFILLFAVGLGPVCGCGSSPPPKGDPVAYDRQMRELNEEVLRQEGKLPARKP